MDKDMKNIFIFMCVLGIYLQAENLDFRYKENPVEAGAFRSCFTGFYLGASIPYQIDYYYWELDESSSVTKRDLGSPGWAPGGFVGVSYVFFQHLFTGMQFSGNYISGSAENSVVGSFGGSPYSNYDQMWRNGQFVLVGELGFVIAEKAAIYLIGGGEYTKVHFKQEYLYTTGQSGTRQDFSDLWGWVLGLGTKVAPFEHFELGLEVTYSYMGQFSVPDVENRLNTNIIKLRQLFGTLNLVCQF